MRIKCIDAGGSNFRLEENKIYEVSESDSKLSYPNRHVVSYLIDEEDWAADRFEVLVDIPAITQDEIDIINIKQAVANSLFEAANEDDRLARGEYELINLRKSENGFIIEVRTNDGRELQFQVKVTLL